MVLRKRDHKLEYKAAVCLIKAGYPGANQYISMINDSIIAEGERFGAGPGTKVVFAKSGQPITMHEYMAGRYAPLMKAIEKYWRHCGRAVKAKYFPNVMTAVPGLCIECSVCTNKHFLYGEVDFENTSSKQSQQGR